jgi:hypothetical protein
VTRSRRPRRSRAEAPKTEPEVEIEVVSPPPAPYDEALALPTSAPVPAVTLLSAVNQAPAVPGPRRAIFIDVENTSSKGELTRVLDALAAEAGVPTPEIAAIGNWRVVGQDLARALSERGAQLVHSAPVTRVSDWSDLWIAVSAGIWLGRARPGDVLQIVSHDRAFDAVGDAAARLGVLFQRVTYRGQTAAVRRSAAGRRASEGPSTRRLAEASVARRVPDPPAIVDEEAHSAPVDEIQQAIANLTRDDPGAGVTLDALTLALKAQGFQRPEGSPRLITRLKRMKDVEVSRDGRVRLVQGAETVSSDEPAVAARPGRRRRRSRRGGRRHKRRRDAAAS